MSQATRTTREIAKNSFGSLSNHAVCDNRAQNASWTSPDAFLEAFGALQSLSWTRLGRSWAAFGRSWASLGRLLDACWALLVASGLSWRTPFSILRRVLKLPGTYFSKYLRTIAGSTWYINCCVNPILAFTYVFLSPPAARRYVRSTSAASRRDAERAR